MYELNEKNYVRVRLKEVDSTNDYAKEKRAEGQNMLVTAERQRGGRGTKGRSFSSEVGGVYMTRLSFYEDFPAKDAFKIMVSAAVAVCETLVFYGLQPQIKWPNDILVNGKKICGILIENALSGNKIASSVVGLGLNVCNPLPNELFDIATTMQNEGVTATVEEVTARLEESLTKEREITDYRKYVGFMGEQVTLIFGEEKKSARLLSVTEAGCLEVEIDGEVRLVSAGEVSLRV